MKLIKQCAAAMFDAATKLRNRLYDNGVLGSHKSLLPVISIGNIQVGGSGKTPLTIYLARALADRGRRPAVLSRGYGANVEGPLLVTSDTSADRCGDEPLLIARATGLPVVVSPDRVSGAAYIEGERLGDLIILDDGLQHRRLRRDLEIVLVNVGSDQPRLDFLENRLMPYGSLREDRVRALARAHIVIFSYRKPQTENPDDSRLAELIPNGAALYRSFFEGRDVISLAGERPLERCEVVAFCGIAQPEGFYNTLEALGYRLHDKVAWPDHHSFNARDLSFLRKRYPGHPLVCTEKDGVRIFPQQSENIYVLRGAVKVSPADAFLVQVMKAL